MIVGKAAMFTILIGTLFFKSNLLQAQYNQGFSRWEVGAGASALIYMGDLTTHRLGSIETVKPGALAFVNYKLDKRWMLQGGFAIGSLKGDDAEYANPAFRRERNFAFTSSMKEVSVKAQYNLFGDYKVEATTLSPYISAGAAVNFINVKPDYSRLTAKLSSEEPQIVAGLQQDIATGTPGTIFTIPVTLGVRKTYNEKWDLFAEGNFRYSFTDYLDGFSRSVNSKSKDQFYTINVGLVYKFQGRNALGCPTF